MRGRSKFRLPKRTGEEMIERLRIDGYFLSNVYATMDYSLLGHPPLLLLTLPFPSPWPPVGVSKKLIDASSQSPSPPSPSSEAAAGAGPTDRQSEDQAEGSEEFGNTRIQVDIPLLAFGHLSLRSCSWG
jgi:hypothetical protein